MFKRAGAAWNSRTPVWLHNGTKENLIAQIGAAIVICVALGLYDEYKSRRDFPEMYNRRAEVIELNHE